MGAHKGTWTKGERTFILSKGTFASKHFPMNFMIKVISYGALTFIHKANDYSHQNASESISDQSWSGIDQQLLNYDHISDIALNCWGISRNCWVFGSTDGGSWAVNLGDGETHWQPWTMVELPNNCRIALNTLVKIQTMVVKIINTIVEISNSQMLKYMQDIQNSGGSVGTSWHLLL